MIDFNKLLLLTEHERRTAFTLFGNDIYWYGIIITLGMVSGLLIAMLLLKRRNMKTDYAIEMFLFAVPLAVIGARIYYVLSEIDKFPTIGSWFAIRDGGLAIYGGIIGGSVGLWLFSMIRKVPFVICRDVAAVAVILGQCIGRWGNFVNQEAFGYQITNPELQWFPFGVFIENNAPTSPSWHYATFFYESFWNLVGFLILFFVIDKKAKFAGLTSSIYLIYEGIGRAWIEQLRTDSLYFLKFIFGETIRVSQMLSIFMLIFGTVSLIILLDKYKKGKQTVPMIASADKHYAMNYIKTDNTDEK